MGKPYEFVRWDDNFYWNSSVMTGQRYTNPTWKNKGNYQGGFVIYPETYVHFKNEHIIFQSISHAMVKSDGKMSQNWCDSLGFSDCLPFGVIKHGWEIPCFNGGFNGFWLGNHPYMVVFPASHVWWHWKIDRFFRGWPIVTNHWSRLSLTHDARWSGRII